MQFEIGKYYKHSGGKRLHIVGVAKTYSYGWTLVGEEMGYDNLLPVGSSESNAENYIEITEEEWKLAVEEKSE